MSSAEKKRILKMVEAGKITPEEGNQLLEALNASPSEHEEEAPIAEAGENPAFDTDERLKSLAEKVRSFWYIPLWAGIGLSLLGGWWMMRTMEKSGFGFWFYCAWLPLLLGVLAIATAVGTRSSRWLFVRIRQAPGEHPENIAFGFPLPLRFSIWLVRRFGHLIMDVDLRGVDDVLENIADSPQDDPVVIVDVHDEEADEHVQIFVG